MTKKYHKKFPVLGVQLKGFKPFSLTSNEKLPCQKFNPGSNKN